MAAPDGPGFALTGSMGFASAFCGFTMAIRQCLDAMLRVSGAARLLARALTPATSRDRAAVATS